MEDQFYGERVGWIVDPFGHRWSLNSVIEQLSPATIRERYVALITER